MIPKVNPNIIENQHLFVFVNDYYFSIVFENNSINATNLKIHNKHSLNLQNILSKACDVTILNNKIKNNSNNIDNQSIVLWENQDCLHKFNNVLYDFNGINFNGKNIILTHKQKQT